MGEGLRGPARQACVMLEQLKACQTRPDPRLRTLHRNLPPAEREKVVEFIAEVRSCRPVAQALGVH
jgi:hypothetical protein